MKGNILIVDDEQIVRDSLKEILRLEGYEVEAVGSGEEAKITLKNNSFDLMLLDLKMPGIDGLEVLRDATKLAPDIRVILLTAHGSLESAIEALHFGAHDYILKPSSPRVILSSIARGLAKKAEQHRKRMLLDQIDSSLRHLKDAEGVVYSAPSDQTSQSLPDGMMVDLERREIWRGSHTISLTPTEGRLMKVFLDHRGRVLSHTELVFLVQGYETTEWEAPEVLRPLISRLRRKLAEFPLGENWISNVRGTGYVFDWDEKGAG
jgi:DNA-binding response OmpR family regulator